jgi:two-component system, NarL family, nitrate/nitrite response regulator NarL
MMENAIRIVLVDDHAVFVAALRSLIDTRPGMKVVGEAKNRVEALNLARSLRPDIIILDIVMGDENGLDYIQELISESGGRVIVLTGVLDPRLHQQAIQQGAMGVVLKTQNPDILLKAVTKVQQGEAWIDRITMGLVLTELSRNRMNGADPGPAVNQVTKREREIITFVAQGLKNKQVADRLHLSEITVRHHLTSIYSKLGVADRFELIVYAYNHTLCDRPK